MASSSPSRKNNFGWIALGLLGLSALILLFIFLLTDVYVQVANALGMGLPQDEQLIIYDAVCHEAGMSTRLKITFWADDAAPLQMRYSGRESLQFDAAAGLQSVDIFLTHEDRACPSTLILQDLSRPRRAGATVEELRFE